MKFVINFVDKGQITTVKRSQSGGLFFESPENAIRKTATLLFCKSGLFICCKGDKN